MAETEIKYFKFRSLLLNFELSYIILLTIILGSTCIKVKKHRYSIFNQLFCIYWQIWICFTLFSFFVRLVISVTGGSALLLPLFKHNQSAPPLVLPLAVQTQDYSKYANSSSPVSQIRLYNPQRTLLLCTRWIVCGYVLRRRRRSSKIPQWWPRTDWRELWWHMKKRTFSFFNFFI